MSVLSGFYDVLSAWKIPLSLKLVYMQGDHMSVTYGGEETGLATETTIMMSVNTHLSV